MMEWYCTVVPIKYEAVFVKWTATRGEVSLWTTWVHLAPFCLWFTETPWDPQMSGVDRYITRPGVRLNAEVKSVTFCYNFTVHLDRNQLQSLSVWCSPHVWSLSLCGPTGSLHTLLYKVHWERPLLLGLATAHPQRNTHEFTLTWSLMEWDGTS